MKPKAEAWLRESFAEGVDERDDSNRRYYNHRQSPRCWLAQHDPLGIECGGRLERFHFIGRQRVEGALGDLLPLHIQERGYDSHPSTEGPVAWLSDLPRDEVILLAAWDPRNGGVGCEHHHRRYDGHMTPKLDIPGVVVPKHVLDFLLDYGLEREAVKKFTASEVIGPLDDPTLVL